jgi:hypothetical protein
VLEGGGWSRGAAARPCCRSSAGAGASWSRGGRRPARSVLRPAPAARRSPGASMAAAWGWIAGDDGSREHRGGEEGTGSRDIWKPEPDCWTAGRDVESSRCGCGRAADSTASAAAAPPIRIGCSVRCF